MAPFAFQLLHLVGAKTVARGTPKPRRNSPAIRRREIACWWVAGNYYGALEHIK